MGKSTRWDAIERIRFRQARKLLEHYYGFTVPNNATGRADLRVALHLKARCVVPENRVKALLNTIGLLAPWMPKPEAEQLADKIAAKPMKLKAVTLGKMLRLDAATRERLELWQLAAVDDTAETKKARRQRRNAGRERRRRRATGCKPRAQYRAEAVSNTKPWEIDGVSRRTWYRRQSQAGGTSPWPGYFSTSAHGPVPAEAKEGAAEGSASAAPPEHRRNGSARPSTQKVGRVPTPQAKTRTCANHRRQGAQR